LRLTFAGGRRISALLTGALLFCGTVVAVPASAAPVNPKQDPFYAYTGNIPLANIAPGTVLKKRAITVAFSTLATPVTGEQLLYRTRGELGEPTVTVTTVLTPATGPVLPRIVDYLSFYDALGAQCDPSYTIAGGDPGAANKQQAEEEEGIILGYLANDLVVTVPDFEGENLEWTAGHEAGYGALDALRATESYLSLPTTTKTALSGYSGGSIAAEWASELAPTYAPKLNIVGVAEGGIPVDFAHTLNYINGTPDWSGVLPAALVALARAYRINLPPYLSPYGAQLAAQVQTACIGSFQGAYPGLTIQKLLKPQYQDIFKVPDFVHVMNALIMGSVPGHPKGPLLMVVGNADGTGDGVMIKNDVEALAHEYCQQGVHVQFNVFNKADHTTAGGLFEPVAVSFLQARFAGVPFAGNCSSVGAGNSLAPLPEPSGASTPDASGSGTTNSTVGRSLAATGLSPWTPVTGIALILLATSVLRQTRRRQLHPRAGTHR
jgi:hypothetical protein